tara:strand:- start:841 stop:1986 length:1146 start_codon:yes stop_codon:yes gene_type:complete
MVFIRVSIGLVLLVLINELNAQQTALKGVSRMQCYNYVYDDDTLKSFETRALGYFRNTEFFHPMEKGRTIFGLQALSFWKSEFKEQQLEIGIGFNQFFGGATRIYPHVALVKHINNSIGAQFRFGSLSNPGHFLPEPFYNPANRYETPFEYGMQFISESTDFWINWDQSIDFSSPFKESFLVGINKSIKLSETRLFLKKIKKPSFQPSFEIRFFSLYRHFGGQIDSDETGYQGNRIQSGFQISIKPQLLIRKDVKNSIIHLPKYEYFLMRYDDPLSKFSSISYGFGHLHQISLNWKNYEFSTKFWRGRNWLSPFGQGIYQSFNPNDLSTTYKERSSLNIISIKWLGITKGLKNFYLGYDIFFDNDLKDWNSAFTLNFFIRI